MKRPTFLYWHLRGINRSVAAERKRFFRLYPIALLVCGFGFGSVWKWEKQAVQEFERASRVSDPSQPLARIPGAIVEQSGPSYGINQTWIGETRSGEPIRETPTGISFRF